MSDQNHQDSADTVVKRKNRFSKRDWRKADTVRRFQHVAGYLSDQTISCSVGANGVKNITISHLDVAITKDFLGPSRHSI